MSTLKGILNLSLIVFVAIGTAAGATDAGWVSLFDGKDLSSWESHNGGPPGKGWIIEDGCIFRQTRAGDILTKDQFEDFELELEWKIAEKSNSGIKYRFKHGLGPEYQILDDGGRKEGKNPYTSASSMYLMAKPNDQKALNPVGEWNTARIVAKGNQIEHWLNGRKVLEVEIDSVEWKAIKATTKFKNAVNYGIGPGKILLQDHNDPVWFRNIRIRKL